MNRLFVIIHLVKVEAVRRRSVADVLIEAPRFDDTQTIVRSNGSILEKN